MTKVAAGLATLIVLTLAGIGSAAAEPSGGSGSDIGIGGSRDTGAVIISGQRRSPASGGSTDSGDRATLSVTCGTTAEKQLTSLGDIDAQGSVNTCDGQQLVCGVSDVGPKERRVAVVQVTQQQDDTWQYTGSNCVVIGPRQVTPEMVRQQAVRLIPTAQVGLAPHGSSLVNIETVMWAGAPRTQQLAPVTLLGQQVRVRIVLDHVAWNFGDETGDADGPAGRQYDEQNDPCRERQCAQYYGHTYTRTGPVTVSATAYWRASFTVGDGAPVDIPGTVGGPTSEAQLVVKQARGVLVPNPGDN